MDNTTIFEFRGVDNFYFAEILEDSEEKYETGTPVHIPVQEIGKSTDSSSEAHYYDNGPMIVINSESADQITLTLAPPPLAVYAKMVGKAFDDETGMLVDSNRNNKYFAIMYRTKGTDGGYRYVTRSKGTFAIPEETYHTEDDSTDTNNMQITFTGIQTLHKFRKGVKEGGVWKPAGVKGIIVDERYGLANVANYFDAVQTPDTIRGANEKPVTGVTVTPETATLTAGDTEQLTANITPVDATDTNVLWYSSDTAVATVSGTGLVTAVAAGSANITVQTVDGGFQAVCAVTVE